MIPNTDPSKVTPQPNPSYPLARLNSSTYAAPLSYNQPTEVVGGYDAKINPMTGEELGQTNFARGGEASSAGLGSLLAAHGRRGDSMLVHMHPEEVQGLQALAMAHGGSLTINPETGLPEAFSLKQLLPTIIGATLNTFAPGVGKAVGSLIPGLSETAAQTIGTGLVVGGAYGLIEGDLKKGLAAGLGAYSGANIAQSLNAAAMPAPARPSAEEMAKTNAAIQAQQAARETVGATEAATRAALPSGGLDYFKSTNVFRGTPTAESLAAGRQAIARDMPSGGLLQGLKGLATSDQSRTAFGQALGGGFQSPFMQNIAKSATFSGLANAFQPEPVQFPGAGGTGEDIVYIPGEFNPLYGTGRDQPYQLPGKYYKRTPQGLVPFNPFALAPGGRAAGGEIYSYADGGVVDPNADPGGAVMASSQNPFSPYFTDPVSDPNVAATRAYIEELNRRARNPVVTAYPGGAGLGGVNTPYSAGAGNGPGGGGGGGGGGGSLTGNPLLDTAISGVAQHYIQEGIGKGVGAIKDYFDTRPDAAAQDKLTEGREVTDPLRNVDVSTLPAAANVAAGVLPSIISSIKPLPTGTVTVGPLEDITYPTGQEQPIKGDEVTDPLAGKDINTLPGAAVASVLPDIVSPFDPTYSGRGYSVDVGQLGDESGETTYEKPGEPATAQPSTSAAGASGAASLAPAVAAVAPNIASGVGSLAAGLGKTGGYFVDGMPVITATKIPSATKAVWDAAYDKALAANGGNTVAAGKAADFAAARAEAGVLRGTVIPGIQAALGLQQAYQGISKGNEAQAALGAAGAASGIGSLFNIGALGGPAGMLAAAAIAAVGASLVQDKEMGDVALRNYWKGIDQGRGLGESNPTELAQGFINFYRTNKNDFPGQAKYGRTGNEEFMYDMTQVINDAVKSGKVDKGADAEAIYKQVVQPWLNTMGEGPKNADARRVQDFMMTDLIHNFMKGAPISNAQVKGDKKFKIVSEKPVYAGTPPASMQMYGQMPANFQGRPGGIPEGAGREGIAALMRTPEAPTMRTQPVTQQAMTDVTALPPVVPPPVNPFVEPEREYIQPMPFDDAEFTDGEEEPRGRGKGFNYGGAVGDDYNFGFAGGGMPGEYAAGGKLLDGPGDGMSDDIPAVIRGKGVQRAALADGEFVIPADVVSHLGNGSTKAGAKKLYDMMARVRQARTGRTRQAPAVKTARLLPA